ncbi:leucine-rich repeat domain-containing protein [Oscillospiraceae bacterium 44-5]
MRKNLYLVWLAALTAALLCGCSSSQASASANTGVVPAAVSEPAPEPPPPPPYTLDRSNIPEEVNVEVTTLSSEVPVRYSQVLDEAERQGDQGQQIDLTGYRLTVRQIQDVTARCKDRSVSWQLDVDGVAVTPDMTELDLSGHDLAGLGVDLYELFGMLPSLTRADLCQTGFTNADYAALQDTFPDIRMIWEIVWHHWTFRTDVVAFSTMKTCAQTFFLYDEDAQYLRYCTDLVALDLGHNRVHDWSFLQYMPNLKILIAVDNQVKDLSWIQYTPKLEYLEFFVGYVTDLSFLQYTPNLKDLNISYNRVSDATYLYDLPNLERLWMEHTRISSSEFKKLQETYPDAKIVYYGEGSIDQGWRTHERYYAMRDMFKNNYVHELFADP